MVQKLKAPPVVTKDQAIRQAQPGTVLSYDVPLIGAGRLSATGGFFPGLNLSYGFNPDIIDYGTYDRMRGDSMIRAALTLIKAPVLGQLRQAQASAVNPKVQAFLKKVIIDSGLLFRAYRTSLRALEFGMAAHEKAWTVKNLKVTYKTADPDTGEEMQATAWDGPALIYKELKEVNPSTIRRIVRRGMDPYGIFDPNQQKNPQLGQKRNDGSFDGFVQMGYFGYVNTANTAPDIYISAARSYIYTHELEYGNMWGRPRTKDAYPYYFWKQTILKFWMAWAEKKVVPPRIARFPIGKDAITGKDNGQIAIDTLNMLDNVTGIALPSTHIKDTPGISRRLTESDWDIKELQVTDRSDTFNSIFTTLNIEILRAMFVPERTFTQGDTGAYAMAQAHTDTFLMTLDATLVDILEAINRWVVYPLILVNFGPEDADNAVITIPGITDEEREFVRGIFTEMVSNPQLQLRIDFDAIAEKYGVPLKDEDLRNEPAPGVQPPMPNEYGAATEEEENPEAEAEQDTGIQTTPANLILQDEDEYAAYIALAGYDPDRWDVTPDDTAQLGYRVIDTHTGKRITGFAGYQVIQSYLKASAKGAKSSNAAAKRTATAAAAAARRAQNQAVAGTRAAIRSSQAYGRAAARTTRQAAIPRARTTPQARGGGAGTEAARNAADRQAVAALGRASRPGALRAAAQGRFPAPLRVPTATTTQRQPKPPKVTKPPTAAVIRATTVQRVALQASVARQPAARAAVTASTKGWSLAQLNAQEKQTAIQQAAQQALQHPENMYTVVRTADGWTVAAKPRTFVMLSPRRKTTYRVLRLSDVEDVPFAEYEEEVYDDAEFTKKIELGEIIDSVEPEDRPELTAEQKDQMLEMIWSIARDHLASLEQAAVVA